MLTFFNITNHRLNEILGNLLCDYMVDEDFYFVKYITVSRNRILALVHNKYEIKNRKEKSTNLINHMK